MMAPDRPGIVSLVIGEVRKRGWIITHVWAEARGGTFFLVIEFDAGHRSPRETDTSSLKDELRRVLRAEVLLAGASVEFSLEEARPAFGAEIVLEGGQVLSLLAETTALMARENVSIASIDTKFIGDQTRYSIRAIYDSRTRESLRASFAELSKRGGIEFIAN